MPCPANFTTESITLLEQLRKSSDDFMRTTPVLMLLKEKWEGGAFKFFFIQFFLFIVMLLLLILIVSLHMKFRSSVLYTLVILCLLINTFFLIYEILQIKIRSISYFLNIWNFMDIIRLTLIYLVCIQSFTTFEMEKWLTSMTFLMIWIKILNYLAVFQATRYFIKMILEIIGDILIFLVILIIGFVAYA